MTNEDQIAALFAKANPVPSLDLLDPVEALDMERLAHPSARSSEMTDVKPDDMKPQGPGRRPRLVLGLAVAVMAAVAVGFLVNNDDGEVASPSTTESAPTTTTESAPSTTTDPPEALRTGVATAGAYVATPFAEEATICVVPPQTGCIDPVGAESISFTFDLPRGWLGQGIDGIWKGQNLAPHGAAMMFNLGGWVYSDPCTNNETYADIPVGLTVDDFANALADHPLLEVTTPIDVTLDGYSGKYLDLQVPADISECAAYRAWEFWLFAQGPGHRWHLWILDVDGVRVVIEGMDYEGTSAEVQAELQAAVDSIQIEP
ncbi:MAG TPA: hypothetical protein VJA46_02765 [Acidimicrobiia bacterium]|nr:hypothetical protein [Acidimicrobiia bacterium]